MDPLTAHMSGQEQYAADPEIRRLKRLSSVLHNTAMTYLNWRERTVEETLPEETAALSAVHRSVILSAGLDGPNRPTRDQLREWSRKRPEYAFFHAAYEGAPIEEFVNGELRDETE